MVLPILCMQLHSRLPLYFILVLLRYAMLPLQKYVQPVKHTISTQNWILFFFNHIPGITFAPFFLFHMKMRSYWAVQRTHTHTHWSTTSCFTTAGELPRIVVEIHAPRGGLATTHSLSPSTIWLHIPPQQWPCVWTEMAALSGATHNAASIVLAWKRNSPPPPPSLQKWKNKTKSIHLSAHIHIYIHICINIYAHIYMYI